MARNHRDPTPRRGQPQGKPKPAKRVDGKSVRQPGKPGPTRYPGKGGKPEQPPDDKGRK